VQEVTITQRTAGGHVQQVRIRGTRATLTLSGAEFRAAVGALRVRSLSVRNTAHTRGLAHLVGRGSGHGAGLCQWGAQGRALAGQTYRQILQAYYSDATLEGSPHIRNTPNLVSGTGAL
jgi:stage II sporulation protein D